MTSSTTPTEGLTIMAIRSETRTIHTITVELPDDLVGKIHRDDEVEVIFTSRVSGGRMPRPTRMSWSMLRWVMGWDN
jgi:hypothetical protein